MTLHQIRVEFPYMRTIFFYFLTVYTVVLILTKHQAELVLRLIFLGPGDALLEAECLVNSLLNVNVLLLLLLLLGLALILLALILAVHYTGHVQRRL
jgi:hypothetical protein